MLWITREMRRAVLVGLLSVVLATLYHMIGGIQMPNLGRVIYHSASRVVLSDGFLTGTADLLSSLDEFTSCALWSVHSVCPVHSTK